MHGIARKDGSSDAVEIECEDATVFAQMETWLSETDPKVDLGLKRDRWVIGSVLAGVAMTVPSILGLEFAHIEWVTLAGMVVELSAFVVLAYRQLGDLIPEFVDAKRKFAVELDAHYRKHENYVAELRSLPQDEAAMRLAYVDSRLESLSQRYSILFGPVDKLGFLPLLAGIFFQVQAIESVSAAMGLLAFVIIGLYFMALWIARFRLQLQSYARILRAAQGAPDTGRA